MAFTSVLLVVTAILLGVEAKFPSYFFSQQGRASPPNCKCNGRQPMGGSTNGNMNGNLNSNMNQFNNQPGTNNFNPNFNPNFNNNNNMPYPANNNPSNNMPSSGFSNNNNNNFKPGSNYPANSNPYNTYTYPNNNFQNSNNNPGSNQPRPINPFNSGQFPTGNMMNQRRPHFGRGQQMTNNGMSMKVCGTDGRNYTDPCLIVNAQSQNQNLGGRPCDLQSAVQAVQMQQGSIGTNGMNSWNTSPQFPQQQPFQPQPQQLVCMNDGTTVQSADDALSRMLNSPVLGIRCQGGCPCVLSCPPTANNRNSAGKSPHHTDVFNHRSFLHRSGGQQGGSSKAG